MVWKEIEGYKYYYRISDQAVIQRYDINKGWVTLKTCFKWGRLQVRLKKKDNKQTSQAVVNLMDKYFFNGYARKNGLNIFHKNGSKSDCAVENLEFLNQNEIGKRCGKIGSRKTIIVSKNGKDIEAYPSIKEAAKKNNISTSSLMRRLRGEVFDEKGRQFRYG